MRVQSMAYLSCASIQSTVALTCSSLSAGLPPRAGITPAVITGRDSAALRRRLEALGVVHVRYGTEDKRPAAEAILGELGLTWSDAAAMGDDWPDLPMLRRAALACAPATAHAEVLALRFGDLRRQGTIAAHHAPPGQPGLWAGAPQHTGHRARRTGFAGERPGVGIEGGPRR